MELRSQASVSRVWDNYTGLTDHEGNLYGYSKCTFRLTKLMSA